MPQPVAFESEAEACLAFEPHSKKRIAYLQTLVIGPTSIPPDIMGAEPETSAGSFKTASGSGTAGNSAIRGVFTKPTVGPMTSISWDGTRTSPITVKFLCSSANRANLELMLRSTTIGTVCRFCFTVYEWDWVNGGFYVRFATNAPGGDPIGQPAGTSSGGFGPDKASSGKELQGYIAHEGDDLKIVIPTAPTDLSGMTLWEFEITFKPPTISAMQEMVIATSKVSKLLLPWAVQQSK